jgi:hypothetical protein
MPSPLVYIVLGAAGSGRRAVLAELIGAGLDAEARPLLLVAPDEMPAPEAVRRKLASAPGLVEERWSRDENGGITAGIPAGTSHVFVLTDGRASPVDQIEALHAWLPSSGLELARVLTVVSCRLASAHRELLRWFDACVHFSDVVLLNQRDGVPNKWLSDFVARYRKEHFPCLIEFVKKGELANPALVLEPQARRMSMLFDPPEAWPSTDAEGGEDDEGDDAGGAAAGDELARDLIGADDPWLERLAGSGRRVKELPDIAKFLSGASNPPGG